MIHNNQIEVPKLKGLYIYITNFRISGLTAEQRFSYVIPLIDELFNLFLL